MKIIGSQAIAGFVFLIPLCMVFTAWFDIAQQFMIRKKRFNVVAQADVLQALIINSAKVAIGWFRPLAAVLIVLSTVRIAMHAGILGLKSRMSGETKKEDRGLKDKTTLYEVATRYYDFPVYRTPQVFVNAVSQSLPVLMLASFFGPVSAGFYVLGRRLLTMPSQLLGMAVGNVFYPRITEAAHNREDFGLLILKTTLGLAAIGILPFAIVVAVGPWLFGLVFGAEWKIAGEYARWLSFFMFSAFISRPSVVSIPVLNMQRFFLIFEINSIGLLSFALFISFYIFRSDIIAIFSFSVAGVLLNLFLIFITIRKNNNNGRTG